jgi:phospholipid N-methyltransferase
MNNTLKILLLATALSCTQKTAAPVVTIPAAALATTAIFVGGWVFSGLQGNSLQDLMFFGKEVYKKPTEMGAGFPCSKYLARTALAKIPAKTNSQPRAFLEIGAGTGIVTNEFITTFKNELREGSTLDVVELQGPLCDILEKKFATSPGVKIHCTPIQNFYPNKKYDAIIMTIPFNSFPHSLVQEIWNHILRNLLAEGGTVSYVNYAVLPSLKPLVLSSEEKKDFKKTQDYLDELFKKNGIDTKYELRNLLPMRARYLKFGKEDIQTTAQA